LGRRKNLVFGWPIFSRRRAREALADVNARHGDEPGVSFYTHISDQFGPYHTKVIAATASEAPHVLDGLLNHLSGGRIEEHYTDTGGATDHVFGLCHLFGFRFAPRLRDIKDRKLYLFPGDEAPSALAPLVGGVIDADHLAANFDDVLRLATSIRSGATQASAMLKKLSGFPRQNGLAVALRDIGRIERSLFMLDWYSNPELRRRTGLGLNKGEARNTLARAVFFNRLGELRDRSFENQAYRASGLNLIVAAIILWNTRYLAPVFAELARLGHDASPDMIRHVAPLGCSTSLSPATTPGISPKPPRPKRSDLCAPRPRCSQPEFVLRSHERGIKCTFVT
jgi:TnpA family transposase